ncbi:hypothetical protein [Krasilnikovia sp. M28-CT-15]|uniref:hypothetical protein n=1 Tax=Krasilnikovia sp. M28-CT-15 TaxID=3373540 RepID=UPI00399D47DA
MVLFVLAQSVQQVGQIEDRGPVEEFVAAASAPSLHDRVHAGHPTPLSTTVIPASPGSASNRAGYTPARWSCCGFTDPQGYPEFLSAI